MNGVRSIPYGWCGSVSHSDNNNNNTTSPFSFFLYTIQNEHDDQARPYSATGQWLPDYSSATAAATTAVPSTGVFAYNRQETNM